MSKTGVKSISYSHRHNTRTHARQPNTAIDQAAVQGERLHCLKQSCKAAKANVTRHGNIIVNLMKDSDDIIAVDNSYNKLL